MAVAPDPLVPLTLVSGDEELLVTRAVAAVVAAARERDAEADVRDLGAGELDAAAFLDLATPSLFGDLRVVVIREAADLADDVRSALAAFIADIPDAVHVVVCHQGGSKGKKLVEACQAAGARVVLAAGLDKPHERPGFVQAEFDRLGRKASVAACRAIVESVGGGLRELAAACEQLVACTDGPVDEDAVGRFFTGRAEASGFVVADRAVEGDAAGALVELRQAFATGLDPVPVVAALAAQLRRVARVASAGRRMPPVAIARELKMQPWMVEKAQRQARGWVPDTLAAAHRAVALADLEVKGGGTDPTYAVERAVLAVATRGEG